MNEEVQQCINTVTDDRRSLFKKPQSLIMRINPTVDVRLSYKIPTYKEKTGWVALGYQKEGVSLYTNGPHHIVQFKARYPQIKTGKASLNFKVTDDIPEDAVEAVIHHAIRGLSKIQRIPSFKQV